MSVSSKSPAETNRFRPDMERLEQREAPAAITLPDFYNVRAGRILNRTQQNQFGVAGVLLNDRDDRFAAPPPFQNAGMSAFVTVGPTDQATNLPVNTPFSFAANGGFVFRAPRNFNGVVQFNYRAVTSNVLISASTPVFITVTGPIRRMAVGADQGSSPAVAVYDARTTAHLFTFNAFDAGFRGGVRVATGDFNGDNIDDIVAAAGPTAGPHVKIFNGLTGTEMVSFFAFDSGFKGGVEVATGDLNGDDIDELIVSAGAGRDAHVKVFDGSKVGVAGFDSTNPANVLASFFAYGSGEVNGVRVAVGDIDGDADGVNQLITAPVQGSTVVKVFDIANGGAIQTRAFFAGEQSDTRGLFVTAGDFNGDFADDIAVGSGSGLPEARIYVRNGGTMVLERSLAAANFTDGFVADAFNNPLRTNAVPSFLVGNIDAPGAVPRDFVGVASDLPSNVGRITGGMRVAATYANRDNFADLALAQGPNGFPRVQILDGQNLTSLFDFTVFGGFFGGLNVTGHF